MKKILLIVLPLLLIVGCSKPIDETALIEKDGVMYLQNSDKPYSGEAYIKKHDGDKEEGAYKDGKREGIWYVTDKDGLKYMKQEYKDGKLDMVIPLF